MNTLILNEQGTPILEEHSGIKVPADYSFDCINNYVNCESPDYEDLECLALGMSSHIEALRKVLKEALDLLEYNADYYPESGADDHNTIEKIKAVLGMKDTKSETRVTMSAINNEGAA